MTEAGFVVLESLANPAVRVRVADGQTVGGGPNQRPGHVADAVIDGIPEVEFISGTHARFFRRSGAWFLQNLTGTNWSSLNGQRIAGSEESVALEHGDTIYLTFCGFRVLLVGEAGQEEPPAAGPGQEPDRSP
jgi:pSer/pThr/pTyr-binding forkhead associated (FHA) protein